MAQPIEILISNSNNTTGGAVPTPSNKPTNNNGMLNVAKNVVAMRLANAAIQQAKTCLNTYVSNYGNTTGNYLAQEKMENNIAIAEGALSMGVGIAMGFAVNPVLGAVNLGIQAVAQTFNAVNQINQYNVSLAKQNANAAFNSANLGIILVGGSR